MLAGAAIDPDASERDDVEADAPTASSALSLLRRSGSPYAQSSSSCFRRSACISVRIGAPP